MKILVAEDERDLNHVIVKHLKKNGYVADSAYDGEEASDYLAVTPYDAVILDIMMPKKNGVQVLEEIRNKDLPIPVLFLTAKDDPEDIVKGLDKGADDYLVKPFHFSELLARLRAIIRRKYGNVSNTLTVDDLELDLSKKSVTRGGEPVNLTSKEYEILEYLMQNKDRTLSREQIIDHVWDFTYEGDSNIVDVMIKNIRKKLDVGSKKPVIRTKRGLGYVLKEPE